MIRPKEMDTLHIYIQNLNHLARILNVNSESNISDKKTALMFILKCSRAESLGFRLLLFLFV